MPPSMERFGNSPQSPMDYREKAPNTQAAFMRLRGALQPTRVAYYEWTGTNAPVKDGWQSYMNQWRQIQATFEFAWGICTKDTFDKQPKLFELPAWDISMEIGQSM